MTSPTLASRPSRRSPGDWFIRGRDLAEGALPAIDFQMHTRWTDGRGTVAEMIEAATRFPLQAIAITEHVNAESAWYPDFVVDVKAERERTAGVQVFYGAEIAAADYAGGLKADAAALDTELLLGVVHRYPKRDGSGFWRFEDLQAADAIELEIAALVGLARRGEVDVLGHPGGTTFKKYGAFPVDWLEPAFAAARENGVAVEMNSKYLWDRAGMQALLRRVDPLVSLGSDAHAPQDVGGKFASVIAS